MGDKKDIFIDNNIAKNFSNPMDPEYKKLLTWLINFEENKPKTDFAFLAVSNKLIREYLASSTAAHSDTSIPVLINLLMTQGRLNKITNEQIKEFKTKHFKKKLEKKFLSNSEDREHIPVVLLSDRKFALSLDNNFIHDLLNVPDFNPRVEKRPEKLDYR